MHMIKGILLHAQISSNPESARASLLAVTAMKPSVSMREPCAKP